MRRPIVISMMLLAAVGSFVFFKDFPAGGLNSSRTGDGRETIHGLSLPVAGVPISRPGQTIHIASFNLQVFGRTKASKSRVMDTLAGILRQFDVVAVQEVRSTDQDVIPRLVDHVNAAGRNYDYIVGQRVGRAEVTEQYAFLFDCDRVEADRRQLYTVRDPDDVLQWEPLVGWFRAIGPAKSAAFTFTLVNIRIDPENVRDELSALDDVFRAVRDDGRGEDDVIVLGDFQQGAGQSGPLGRVGGIVPAITGVPTDTQGTMQYDNLLFPKQATEEFTGRAGVLDFMRRYNFTLDEALEVSDHMPVWAEFSVYEGGQPGRTATAAGAVRR